MANEDDDVVPRDEEGRNTMLQLMKLNLPTHAATLGLTNAEVAQTVADANAYAYLRTWRDAAEAFGKEASAFLNLITNEDPGTPTSDLPTFDAPPLGDVVFLVGIVRRLRLLIRKIKASANFNESIGRDLYIIRESERTPNNEKKPTLKATALVNDKVELKFDKQGMKAVRIRRLLAEGTAQNLADPTTSPFIDQTASPNGQPEKRQYQAVYLENNEPVGQYSDIVVVVTTP